MAFWNKDTKKEDKKPAASKVAVAKPAAAHVIAPGAADAILKPHITEKSGLMSQSGIYTFQVAKDANKAAVSSAVKALYKVTPVKVAMVNLPAKQVFVKGRWGKVSAMRKALVTLKKGDKIDFV